MTDPHRTRQTRRFYRQINQLERQLPVSPGAFHRLTNRRYALIRVPLALLLVLGGLVGFLPVLGFWMLPIGLVLLAVDLPFLRAPAGSVAVRLRALARRFRR